MCATGRALDTGGQGFVHVEQGFFHAGDRESAGASFAVRHSPFTPVRPFCTADLGLGLE